MEFRKQVILNEMLIKEEQAEKLLSSFATIAGKTYHIDSNNDGRLTHIKKENTRLVQLLAGKDNIQITDKESVFIKDVVSPLNCYSYLLQDRDLLATELVVNMDSNRDEVTIRKAGLPKVNLANPFSLTDYREFMEEYILLFPQFAEIVNAVVCGRIAPSKESFLYLVAPSNFGKTFFMSAVNKAGLGIEIKDIDSFSKNTGASSVRVADLVDASCLMVDEFVFFNKELKGLTFDVTVAEKFQMAQTIPLGMKLMFSANISASFIGGVDPQLVNRVSMINIENGGLKIENLKTFKKFGKDRCHEYLSFYIREFA